MSDCLIIGGGVIGLSLAYELASHGARVRVLEAGEPGREASWAGAGILPPAPSRSPDPLEQLFALSNEVHERWSAALREATGIDNGFRRCGGLYVASAATEAQALASAAQTWEASGIRCHRVASDQLADLEPELNTDTTTGGAWLLPEEAQLRNPRHLKALLIACENLGVEIVSGAAVEGFQSRGDRVVEVETAIASFTADRFCITSGAWTRAVLSRLGCTVAIKPIRGQIALLNAGRRVLTRILNDGPRYLVPRDDGRILIGSTEEDVGFDRANTAAGVSGLLAFAASWAPALAGARFERAWSGFRPATLDGRPYLGRLPNTSNGFVAAGHFRNGLQLSTGTAVVMRELIQGERPRIDLSALAVHRVAGEH
jgi:glycine oxidase